MPDVKHIWLPRPQEDSEHFAAELAYHQISALIAPVMHVVKKPLIALPEIPDAILLTSRHATHVLGELPAAWRKLPTYCVGAATASYARDFGFSKIIPGTSDIMALLPRLIAEVKPAQNLLYFSGEETRADIPSLLGGQGIHVRSEIVYNAVAEATLATELVTALNNHTVSAVAFFSPRSASIACDLLSKAGLASHASTLATYCLSLNVVKAASTLPWAAIHCCNTPTRRAMRELILSQHRKSM